MPLHLPLPASEAARGLERRAAPHATPRIGTVCRLGRYVERGLAVLGLVLLVYLAGFDLSWMISGSMSPTLRGNGRPGSDAVLTERFTSWFRHPRRWEVVAFRNQEGVQIMKRVVGLPGETVALKRDGTFLVDGAPVARPAALEGVTYYPFGRLVEENSADTGTGYFVLGDDSKDSDDSRFNPPVKPDALLGRSWLIVWPPSRIGFVNP